MSSVSPVCSGHRSAGELCRRCVADLSQIMNRRGMSLVEVIIAAAILAIILSGVLGSYGSLVQGGQNLRQDQQVHNIQLMMAERLREVPWDELGTAAAPWSLQRQVGTDTFMTDDASIGDSASNLAITADRRILQITDTATNLGVLDAPTGIEGLEVYVEYYRAVTDGSGNEGVMDESTGLFQTAADYTTANLAPFLLGGIPSSVDEGIVVWRLVISWDDGLSDGRKELTTWGARRE